MTRAGQPAVVAGPPGDDRLSAGHGDTAVTAGARPDGRDPRLRRLLPAAAPALVRRS
jgi:hypothetical protein